MQTEAAHVRYTTNSAASVTGALRVVESFLLRGGQQTARQNAWTAVLEDRRRAEDRREAQHIMEALVSSASSVHAGPDIR